MRSAAWHDRGRLDLDLGAVLDLNEHLRQHLGWDVLALFAGRLAGFKHPKDVMFIEALPRNAMGKALKYELREMVT